MLIPEGKSMELNEITRDCLRAAGIRAGSEPPSVDILDLGSPEDCVATESSFRPVHWVSDRDPQSLAGDLIVDEVQGTWHSAVEGVIWHSQGGRLTRFRFSPPLGQQALPFVKAVAIAMNHGASRAAIQQWLETGSQSSSDNTMNPKTRSLS